MTTRREFIAAGVAAATTVALAGCSSNQAETGGTTGGNGASGDESSGDADAKSFGGWFENTGNYDGVVDETDSDEVTVKVGTDGNGAGYGFGPAAVRVSSGTTVVWKWTGNGGSHNVVADDGSFSSQMAGEKGTTFEHTFEESGTTKYYCKPHEPMGMKGVVVVE